MSKVLIIEDEEYILEMYKIKFEIEGFEVITAANGQEGYEKAKAERPDIILLDLVMPTLDGFQALTLLRNDEETKHLKAFILSNLGQQEEIDKGMGLGADGFLVKASMTPSELVEKVKTLLAKKESGDTKSTTAQNKAVKKTVRKAKAVATGEARILFIEDNRAIADMYELGLGTEGYRLVLADNGAWGLKVAQEEKFDIIIMDMNMPVMNGYEMLKGIKSDSLNKESFVIVLSNSAQDEDIDKAKAAGADLYLLKATTTPKKLAKEIKKALK